MTNREKVLYLKRYSSVMKKVDRKLAAIDRLRSIQGKVTRSYEPRVSGGPIHKSRDHDTIDKIIDLQRELIGDIDQAIYLYKETSQVISQLDDHRLQLLLELRYISGKTWNEVAVDLEVCSKTVFNLHSKALSQVVAP